MLNKTASPEEKRMRIPKTKHRRSYGNTGYLESDRDYIENNERAVLWFLENRDGINEMNKAARAALQFILTLRDSTPDEGIDLLTNNAGEDIESQLAKALGVKLCD